ncbi:helix-turn-helix transcriptional regulator [Sinorhizobium sp. 7-81]|uniref:response regulator transcription factor n=1 Tax=Sinorhizobium sp. 8-89 TaxID=3049089 RepID=UPI0024C266ED|nr:helix-turn-helix transcriptional regulator [Sinorhizobium sp. 8-89]MDK1494784.1 helix-turn-helix transcriptional regulator [Sinorhizobium sp. 8-89]
MLALIAAGMSNKEAAQRLSRSPGTIEHQVSAVLGKFNAANRMEVLLPLRGEPWLLSAADALQSSKIGKLAKYRGSAARKVGGCTEVPQLLAA